MWWGLDLTLLLWVPFNGTRRGFRVRKLIARNRNGFKIGYRATWPRWHNHNSDGNKSRREKQKWYYDKCNGNECSTGFKIYRYHWGKCMAKKNHNRCFGIVDRWLVNWLSQSSVPVENTEGDGVGVRFEAEKRDSDNCRRSYWGVCFLHPALSADRAAEVNTGSAAARRAPGSVF